MNSWDLFRTLCQARNGNAGEAPIEEHYPIAENVANVQQGDIIVSEYYDPEKATRIVREVCGLDNQVFITKNGKTDGSVWLSLPEKPSHHTGDNMHCDVLKPSEYGIQTTKVTQHQFTPTETDIINRDNFELSKVMREARLTTWSDDPTLRGLQLHQIERNFPFLLKVAHVLHKRMIDGGYTRMLLCSRDCYLLYHLMRSLFPEQDIRYFFNSRLTRYRPTDSYAEYARSMIGDKTLIVDMNGSGNSLKYFTDRFGGTPLLVVSHMHNVPSLVHGGIRETSNPAPHPTVKDIDDVGISSDTVKCEIATIVNAFLRISEIAARDHLAEPNCSLYGSLRRMEDPRTACLWDDHIADSKATYELLKSGPLPHDVVL